MKKIQIYLILLLFILPLFSFLIPNSLANDLETIDYTFEKDVLYDSIDSWNGIYNSTYNIRNQSEFTNHYPATYSFENEVNLEGLNISFIDWYYYDNNSYIKIIDSFVNHNNVLDVHCHNESEYTAMYNQFENQLFGIIELWFAIDSETEVWTVKAMMDTLTLVSGYLQHSGNYIRFYNNDTLTTIKSNLIENQWYHLRIDINCTSDTFDVYLDYELIADNFILFDGIDYISFNKLYLGGSAVYTDNTSIYFDAIGFSWDKNYYTFNEFDINSEFDTNELFYNTWSYNKDINTNGTIVKHNETDGKYLRLYDNNNTDGNVYVQDTFWNTINENIQIFFRINNGTNRPNFLFLDNTNIKIYLTVENNQLKYIVEPTTYFIVNISNDIWYNLTIEYDCNIDTFNVYLDTIYIGNYPFFATANNINTLKFSTSTYSELIFDIDSIKYSWNATNYHINDNLLPTKEFTGLLETDKFEFKMEGINNRLDTGDDNCVGWTDIETGGGDFTNIGADDFEYMITSGSGSVRGIKKENFNVNGNFVNISINFLLALWTDGSPSSIFIEIHSKDNSQITILAINHLLRTQWWNGTDWFQIITGMDLETYYTFNLFINYELDLCFFNYYIENVLQETFILPLINNGKEGLNKIKLYSSTYSGDSLFWLIEYVSVYVNGISQSIEYSYLTFDMNLDYWNYEYNNLVDIIGTGYFALGSAEGIYTLTESSYKTAIGFKNYNNISQFINIYDDYISTINNPTIVITLIKNFSLSNIYIEGCKLIEGSNEYFLEYTHSNINVNTSYFYVDSLHNLNWYHYSDDSNIEYIKATFNISNISTSNYSLGFTSYIDNNAYGYLYSNYTTVNQEFSIYSYLNTRYYLLVQNYTLNKLNILITDNNNDDIEGLTEGYIREITLLPMYQISYDLTITNILSMIIPLLVILIPSFLIGVKYKDIIVPMILFMSIICYIADFIPLWLLFVIIFSEIVYFITNREKINDDLL